MSRRESYGCGYWVMAAVLASLVAGFLLFVVLLVFVLVALFFAVVAWGFWLLLGDGSVLPWMILPF